MAFSASLTGSGRVGPFATETRLVFKNVMTNIGGAYSSVTGSDPSYTLSKYTALVLFTPVNLLSHDFVTQIFCRLESRAWPMSLLGYRSVIKH